MSAPSSAGAKDRPAWRPGGGTTRGAPVRKAAAWVGPRNTATSAEILARLKGPDPVQRAVDRTMLPDPCHCAAGVETIGDEIVAARQRVRGVPAALPRSATSVEVRWCEQAPRAKGAASVHRGAVRWAGVVEALQCEAPRAPTLRVLTFDFSMEFSGDAPVTATKGDAGGVCCEVVDLAATPDDIFALAIVIEPAGCRPQDRLGRVWTSVRHDVDEAALAVGTFDAADNRACGVLCGVLFRGRGPGDVAWSYKPVFEPLPGQTIIDRLPSVSQALAEVGVQPYTVVHVHHCVDCARHATTTKHVPGSYERRFREVARAVEASAQIKLHGFQMALSSQRLSTAVRQ